MMKDISSILDTVNLSVGGKLWLESGGKRFFGPGPVELLEYIELTGSINQAAKKMEMSYKKAWEIVNHLNSITHQPLVITATGGEKGGGSTISDEAKELIEYYRQLRLRFKKFLDEETERARK
jgi:molybdate transport system regulatory protein